MQLNESFFTGRQLALLMQKHFPDRDWMFDLATRAGESRDKVEWHLQEDMAPPRHIGEAAAALLTKRPALENSQIDQAGT